MNKSEYKTEKAGREKSEEAKPRKPKSQHKRNHTEKQLLTKPRLLSYYWLDK